MNQITDTASFALLAGEAGFDPIEERLRANVRAAIEAVFEEELAGFLGRLRYGRGDGPAKGYRHGHRARQLTGTFGTETVRVPRARIEDDTGKVTEWRSKALPRYQRLTKKAEALIAAVYLAGTNTRRVKRALGGLRASELRGLRWQDVDFEAGFIRIRQRADAYNEIGEPKSKAGFRDIPAGPMVLNALRRWKLRCPKSELGLVFPAPRGGILQHTNIQKVFRKLCKDVGVKMRWHDLRHFVVSIWIEQGFSIKEVMTFAGHSSIQMTMERYGHLFPSPDHQKAMAIVEAKLLG